ncbi:hypothetical protein D9613_006636 [Agrocybe pediades]|uniref:Uncharacterized protein n=1 Tax=Agrocybe pediades TaxID=84607 RepID=A0A8H4VHS5_9AGAR|nr:hypothetical protein D9613_006636 [Agrocybe pediades]
MSQANFSKLGEDSASAESNAGTQNMIYDYMRVWKAEAVTTIKGDQEFGLHFDAAETYLIEQVHHFEKQHGLKTRMNRDILFADNITKDNFSTQDLLFCDSPHASSHGRRGLEALITFDKEQDNLAVLPAVSARQGGGAVRAAEEEAEGEKKMGNNKKDKGPAKDTEEGNKLREMELFIELMMETGPMTELQRKLEDMAANHEQLQTAFDKSQAELN